MRNLFKHNPVLGWLSLAYLAVLGFSMINPSSWAVWVAEIIPVLAVFTLIIGTWQKFRFSNTAYILMFVWLFMHTIGARYTFAEVPFDWFNDLIGSERNQYDRLAHYSIGFYAFPIAEFLFRKGYCNKLLAGLFGLMAMMAVAAGYEIIEWWYAVLAGGDEGIAFLGSQGDIWDAQQDMLCDTLGALTSLTLFAWMSSSNRLPVAAEA